jgi:hypothetical protein
MKQCSKCKQIKPLDEYSMKRGKHTTRCKPCNNEYFKKWYKSNKDVHKDRVLTNNKLYKEAAREYVLTYLKGHPCVDCGETNPVVLEFDHIHGKNKNISVMLSHGYSVETLSKEIALCEVRCANCHRIKTAHQFGWWITRVV